VNLLLAKGCLGWLPRCFVKVVIYFKLFVEVFLKLLSLGNVTVVLRLLVKTQFDVVIY
jgi:hypothetical protein